MNIYIIDDEQVSLFLTKQALSAVSGPNRIATFSSAETALGNLIGEFPESIPHVIFLDLNMPGMDGWEFLNELNPYRDHLLGRCRVYVLTSSLDTSDMARAKEEALVDGFIHKPLRKDDIEVILQTVT